MKFFLFLVFLTLFLTNCKSKKSVENKRLQQLTTIKSSDEFMTIFLKFIKDNQLENALLQYEDELIANKQLSGTDEAAYQKYFTLLIQSENKDRCISKATKEKLFKLFFSNSPDYKAYKKKLDNDEVTGTKEYNITDYLSDNGSVQFSEALDYALMDNTLTLEKRYFYLMLTAPTKVCPQ
jgi:hypothetical protein